MQCRWRLLGQARGSLQTVASYALRSERNIPRVSNLTDPHRRSRPLNTSVASWQQLSVRQRRKDIYPTPDTIYALSSAPGRAAIAIVRVSGRACLDIYGGLCPDRAFPHPRFATLRKIVDPEDSSRVLDTSALVLYFPAPNTVTGEDVLEFHVHGGPAVVQSVLEAIPKCTNTRPRRRAAEYSHIRAAEPGEFTKRAFYNGRLDLTQAEALGEILAAETEQQHRLAIAGVDSGLAIRYETWRKTLLYARGELEALIDFSEDQHFDESPTEFMASISKQVLSLQREIELHIQNASRGELLRSGISVALLGPPNAGKSSLLNRVVGREAAIVSSEAGTTRDIVDVSVNIGGWVVRLGDMAGLRGSLSSPKDENSFNNIGMIEQEGIRRAKERAMQSDVVIALLSPNEDGDAAQEIAIDTQLRDAVQLCYTAGKVILFVVNKIDLITPSHRLDFERRTRQLIRDTFPSSNPRDVIFLSCKETASQTGLALSIDPGGIQSFLQGLTSKFVSMTCAVVSDGHSPLSPQEAQSYWTAALSVTHRQSTYLKQCRTHLEEFLMQTIVSDENTKSTYDTVKTVPQLTHHIDGHDDLVAEFRPHEHLGASHFDGRSHSHDAISISADDLHWRSGGYVSDDAAGFDIATAAEHLRYAAACLAKITGRGEGGDVEDVLGVVFEK